MNIYVLAYTNAELHTNYEVFTHKLKAINKFHEWVDNENKEYEEDGREARFIKDMTPEDNVYVAFREDEEHSAKIELRIERIKA